MNRSPCAKLTPKLLLGTLKALIVSDPIRVQVLKAVKRLDLPDCWVAAGFLRNLVWDHLHRLKTPLNDIDVIYYCTADTAPLRDLKLENQLQQTDPELPWSVKNQARMHFSNGDAPYHSCLDAMSYWPEKQTAIAARLNSSNDIELIHCFDLETLFSLKITHNPKRNKRFFDERVARKGWLTTWCHLRVE